MNAMKQQSHLASPALAITRRLPDLPPIVAIEILHNLNALGLTDVPYIEGMLRPGAMAAIGTAARPLGATSEHRDKWMSPKSRPERRRPNTVRVG